MIPLWITAQNLMNSIMKEINLIITLDEGKLIFQALSELPFKVVYDLIGRINSQSIRQARGTFPDIDIKLVLSPVDIALIMEALSVLPYIKVKELIQKINKQKEIHAQC